ncbi:MAG TPA: hypothetical protein VNU92_16475 [Edaphobacter sp.]|nr:hypothetical protein [Edaphobacter sp.]
MTLLREITQIVLAAVGSSGIILLAGQFILDKFVDKRIKFHFDQRLEATKAAYAEKLAELNADLKIKTDAKLTEEQGRYSGSLECLKADLLKDIEGIRSSYIIQQEIKKAELAVETQESIEIFKIRRDKYPSVVELIYRIRNNARDNVKNSVVSTEELKGLIKQLEEKLFQLRPYLGRDELHFKVHEFKNIALALSNRLSDRTNLFKQNQATEAEEAGTVAEKLYQELDRQHLQISEGFEALIAARPHAMP